MTFTPPFSLDNPSELSIEIPSHEPPEALNALEPLTKFFENLKEDSAIRYQFRLPPHTISDKANKRKERKEEDKEAQ